MQERPEVREAAVIAVADERFGERPIAYVVPADGATIDPAALREHLRTRVAKWWVPDRIEVVEALPRTSVGKIDKQRVRRQAAPTEASSRRTDSG